MKKLLIIFVTCVLCISIGALNLNEVKAEDNYLTFTAKEAGTIKFEWLSCDLDSDDVNYISIKTRLNDGSWTSYETSTYANTNKNNKSKIAIEINLNKNDKVSFKGLNVKTGLDYDSWSSKTFSIRTGEIEASGDVTSLTNGVGGDCMLSDDCYSNMFANCTSLTQAPNLPATTLASNCYSGMFYSCTSLTQAPNLPATTLNDGCYSGMFANCTSLTQAPNLPATTLCYACYSGMFSDCTSLTQAPNLPATTLKNECYASMFYNCTSLTQAPNLPATILEGMCYNGMFAFCTSFTQLPKLPATTLTNITNMYGTCGCYQEMFMGCTNIKISSTETGLYSIPYRVPAAGSSVEVTNSLKGMFEGFEYEGITANPNYSYGSIAGYTYTGTTFTGTPDINTTYYLYNDKIEYCTVSPVADVFYNGSAHTPEVVVMSGTKTLTKGTDYTISYSNNTNPGVATVTITGVGTAGTDTFYGTKTINFNIVRKSEPKDETCEAVIGPRWHWNDKTGKCVEEYSVINTATK